MIKLFKFSNNYFQQYFPVAILLLVSSMSSAQVVLEKEVKISDQVMFFDGKKVDVKNLPANSDAGYDYAYGNALTPHGDCVTSFGDFVFLTWYRGGKEDRHVMLTRYNVKTGVSKTIEFPHQHTGYNGKWWIGETHNTIAVGVCPKDSTIHMIYDMHRNGNVAAFAEDYLRYSYSKDGAATVADDAFTLDLFVNSTAGNYKHLAFQGIDDVNTTKLLTYPAFFTNDEGDLFMKMRFGYSENGKFLFAKFDGDKWDGYTDFNRMQASSHGSAYNWGLYGDIKYLNGKIRVGFQQRANIKTDKYQYQNGIYYAYSNDPSGLTGWYNHKEEAFARPIAESDKIKIAEPGDFVQTTQTNQVYIVSGFDWTVTENDDVHFVSKVRDDQYKVTKTLHTYRKAGDIEFTTEEYSAGDALFASGDNVYVIGLKSGRVNIVKTKGGTNNFQEVYQHTSGPTFDKGVVYVNEGKLYYYLKESGGSGDERTTYLQIFDLGIVDVVEDPNRILEFANLSSFQTIARGTDLTIEANVGSDFTEVSLWHEDTNLGTLTTAPYTWSGHAVLTNMHELSYTFKLVAKDANNETVEESITIQTPNQWAYTANEAPHTVPGVLQFEDYDVGGDGVAYYDRSAPGDGKSYRDGETVDLNSDGTVLVYIQGQEWLEYTVDVQTQGHYDLMVTHANRRKATNQFDVTLPDEGITLLAGVDLDSTGGVFQTQNLGNFIFEKGTHVLRFGFTNYGYDLDSMQFVLTEAIVDDTENPDDVLSEDLPSAGFSIYPNPASDQFMVNLKGIQPVSLSIFSVNGAILYKKSVSEPTFTLSTDGMDKGIYLVQVIGKDQRQYTQRLVIK